MQVRCPDGRVFRAVVPLLAGHDLQAHPRAVAEACYSLYSYGLYSYGPYNYGLYSYGL